MGKLMVAASTKYVDWSSMWKILVIGIVAGAGLVAVYSLGLVALSASGYLRGDGDRPAHRNVLALAAAVVCALVVVAGVAYGIREIFNK
jgi:hypothetical protein